MKREIVGINTAVRLVKMDKTNQTSTKFHLVLLIFGTSLLSACSDSGKKDATRKAEDLIANRNQLNVSCSTKGTTFTGQYEFAGSNGVVECADENGRISLPDIEGEFDCEQKEDGKFECHVIESPKYPLLGCMDDSNNFKIQSQSDLGFIMEEAEIDGVDERVEAKVTISGTLSSDGGKGKLQFAALHFFEGKREGCFGSWDLEMKRVSD